MKPNACAVFLLLICPLQRADCSLPLFTPATATLQEKVSANWESNAVMPLRKNGFMRLPGICRRLKRRRVTIVCNLEKFCWGRNWWRRQKTPPGQVCRCPQGSRCSHFFLHSI